MGHSDKRRISAWLKDLREKQFLAWIYDADNLSDMSKPAIYFLSINGIRLLRQAGDLPEDELRKRYKDDSRRASFIAKCLLLADCCLHLEDRNRSSRDTSYAFALRPDLAQPDHAFNAFKENETITPDLVFTKEVATNGAPTSQIYLLQVFDLATPRYMAKSAIRGYIDFLEDQLGTDAPPIVLVTCSTPAELIFAKRYAKKTINDSNLDDEGDMRIRFATLGQLRKQGLTAAIWEQA